MKKIVAEFDGANVRIYDNETKEYINSQISLFFDEQGNIQNRVYIFNNSIDEEDNVEEAELAGLNYLIKLKKRITNEDAV